MGSQACCSLHPVGDGGGTRRAPKWERLLGLTEPASAFDLTLPEKKLADIAQCEEIPLVRMHGVIQNMARPEELCLDPSKDGHLSARGQLLIARALADYLYGKRWLAANNFTMEYFHAASRKLEPVRRTGATEADDLGQ